MAIVGPASYVSTTEDFLAHWLAVNAALGAGNELVVQGNHARIFLFTQYNQLVAKRSQLAAGLNLEETSRGDLDIRKVAMVLRHVQFNDLIRADFSGTKWERALTSAPSPTDGFGVFVPPLDDVNALWLQMDADPSTGGPLKLLGDYGQPEFATDLAALKTAFTTWRTAGVTANITLLERNEIQDRIQPVLVSYRRKVPTKFAEGHPLIGSLPILTPAPGSTPNGVVITVVWDPVLHKARITFPPSTSTDVVRYELRGCAGPVYDTNLESVIASVPAEGPYEFLTDFGLPGPGSVASFKVYVITATGNEKGSNAVSIARA